MAKTLKSEPEAPEAGSAPQIPNRNEEALFLSHIQKLRIQLNKVAIKKAELDGEKSVLNDMFGEAKQDKFSRKELMAILDDGATSRRDLVAEEERRARLRGWAGLPAGAQPDLFALPSPAQDEVFAEAIGLTMGLRGDDPTPPDYVAPMHHPLVLKGWHAGQERLALLTGAEPVAEAGLKLVADNDASKTADAA